MSSTDNSGKAKDAFNKAVTDIADKDQKNTKPKNNLYPPPELRHGGDKLGRMQTNAAILDKALGSKEKAISDKHKSLTEKFNRAAKDQSIDR